MRAFVAMPFGTKQDIDFNAVYSEYVQAALAKAGFVVFRADEELRAGNIRTDMFQQLLLADLVIADLSIDNPNVWYELGVRHALQPRGVVQIQCQRDYMPFDVYVDRTLRYHIKSGRPDPEYLEADRDKLAAVATQTMQSWYKRRISPVYHLLPNLEPPNWKRLRVGEMNQHWQALESWQRKVLAAQKARRVGDILAFAEEAPTCALTLETRLAAGQALLKLEEYAFALQQYELALGIDPDCLEARRKKGLLLGSLGRFEEADVWMRDLVQSDQDGAESWALLGGVERDAWMARWRHAEPPRKRTVAAQECELLREAMAAYSTGFRKDPSDSYAGITALTLCCLLEHLTGMKCRSERDLLEGGVRWAAQVALDKNPRDYRARVALADLELLCGKKTKVEEGYRRAVAVAEQDRFALNSVRDQLSMLDQLEFRAGEVHAAIVVLDAAIAALPNEPVPRQVILFSGHMIDQPNRKEPRFPPDKEPIAVAAIEATLDRLEAGPQDLAICGGACGGDLLFAEAALQRGVGLRIRIPFSEPEFLQQSVNFAGSKWNELFYSVRKNPLAAVLVMPDILGPTPEGRSPYARNNRWMLLTALAWGPEKVRFVCLWNGSAGDGPGGTKDMFDTVVNHSGRVYVLDTRKLW